MKRSQFIRELKSAGCVLKRHGSKHDIYLNPATDKRTSVPRHTELDNGICRDIKKQLGIIPPQETQ
ncbi:MAG: type II toxin-antitoxin system HicA family toxin [Candidatus Dadabacteria bacterium]|nr:type II toxin-antitoxin system HicA family toxin [Candidatus Dadabacteria bacterium]